MAGSDEPKSTPKPEKEKLRRERIEKGIDEERKERGYDHDTDNPFLKNPDKGPPKKH